MESGKPDDPVDVELFSKKARLVGPFRIGRTRDSGRSLTVGPTSRNSLWARKFWSTIKVCVKGMEHVVVVFRYSDGIRGENLGLMYNLLLQPDQLYSSPIEGLPENVRTKVSPRCM